MIGKKELRDKMLQQRANISSKTLIDDSQSICNQLFQIVQNKDIQRIHTYLPMRNEIDVFPLLDQLLHLEKEIFAPKTLKQRQLEHYRYSGRKHLEKGLFKTFHPIGNTPYTGTFDLIIVPGLAFSKSGKRLGYGGGYYDNFLSQHPDALKIGVAYAFQLLKDIPTEPHDAILDKIIVPQ